VKSEGLVVTLSFEQRALVVELAPPHGQLILTRAGKVLAISAPQTGPTRELRPGIVYSPQLAPRPGPPVAAAPAPPAESAKRKKLLRTIEKVKGDLARTENADQHRQLGELISRNVQSIPRGAKSVKLTEYTPEGPREREVPLDSKLGPKEQAQRQFHLYKR